LEAVGLADTIAALVAAFESVEKELESWKATCEVLEDGTGAAILAAERDEWCERAEAAERERDLYKAILNKSGVTHFDASPEAAAEYLSDLEAAEKERDEWEEKHGHQQGRADGLEARNAELEAALREEFLPLVETAYGLADRKDLASAQVARAVGNVRMWLRAALAASGSEKETP